MTPGNLLAKIMPLGLPTGRLAARLIPALVVAYACLLPRELGLEVAGAMLPPYRLALIVMIPLMLSNLARYPVRPSLVDLLAILASVWFIVALSFSTSLDAALFSGVALALDFGLAYFVGRSAIRTPQDLRTLFTWLVPGLVALAALLAVESLGHRMLLRPMLAQLLDLPPPELMPVIRYGLLRAPGPFPHPILAGVFMAAALPLAWFLTHNLQQRVIALSAAVLGVLFTVSAAAVIGMVIAVGLIASHIVQRLTRLPVFLFLTFYAGLAMVGISIGSQNGLISFLIRRATFDSHNSFYRLAIWEYGSAEVARSPWFGIGQRDWVRPVDMVSSTVDSYWLVLAMTYGLPAAILAGAVICATLFNLRRTQRFRLPEDRGTASGLIHFFLILIFAGFTVHLWEGLHAWAIVLCGAGASLAAQARPAYFSAAATGSAEPNGWPPGNSGFPTV